MCVVDVMCRLCQLSNGCTVQQGREIVKTGIQPQKQVCQRGLVVHYDSDGLMSICQLTG